MKIRTGTLAVGIAVFVMATAGACGGSNATPAANGPEEQDSLSADARTAPAVDISVVRRDVHYDYEPASSLTEVAERSPFVAVGEVVGWTDGRSLLESDGSGYEDTEFFAVLEVKVDETYRAPSGHVEDQSIYVEVSRGGQVMIDGEEPEGTVPVFSAIDELNAAVPTGTRVISLGEEAPTASQLEIHTPGGQVQNDGAGYPQGSALLQPDVQGLLFEDGEGGFVSGLADEEQQWGWLPAGTPFTSGFAQLVDELDRFGT